MGGSDLTLDRLDLLASGYAPQLSSTGPGRGEEHGGIGREAKGGEGSSIADLGTEVGEGLEVVEDGSPDVDQATEGNGGFRTLTSYTLACPIVQGGSARSNEERYEGGRGTWAARTRRCPS